ncbi:hypothetical protein BDW22DRAFT_1351313 [Trametopsis cervina]|nr:hypothetical protein BDW22DRAFT_1351313 [Trametopsis cervina]
MSFVNRTIDDQNGDEVTGAQVTYSPTQMWSQGNGCGGCSTKPDASQALDETWHDGSRTPDRDILPLALSFKFTGTAVYLFNILENRVLTDVNITMDGQFVTRFTNTPNLPDFDQFVYNFPVFSSDTLPFGEHTVEMSAFGPDQTLVLFDYAVYTTTESGNPPPPPSSPSPVSTASFQQHVKSTPPSNSFSSSSAASSSALFSSSSSLSSSPSIAASSSLSATSSTTSPSAVGNVAAPTRGSSTTSPTAASPVQTNSGAAVHSPHQINIAALAGGIAGGVLLFLTLLLGWLWYRRHHRKPAITPYRTPSKSSSDHEKPEQDRHDPRLHRNPSMWAHPSEVSLLPTTQHAGSSSHSFISEDTPEDGYTANSVIAQVATPSFPSTTEHHESTAHSAADSGPLRTFLSEKSSASIAANHDAHSLHVEIERLRAQQHQHRQSLAASGSSAGVTSPVEAELRRQISVLRIEMERMRMQHETETETLPSYSPPPSPPPPPIPAYTPHHTEAS